MDIINLKGIGEKKAKLFNKLGIYNTEELLDYYPRTYDKYDKPKTLNETSIDETAAFVGVLHKRPDVRRLKRISIVSAIAVDKYGNAIKLVWFNSPFMASTLKVGMKYVFRGKITNEGSMKKMEHPSVFSMEDYREMQSSLMPVYALTKGINNKTIQDAIKQVINNEFEEYLPKCVKKKYELVDIDRAYHDIHFPKNIDNLKKAKDRMVFDEFFLFVHAIRKLKDNNINIPNNFNITKRKEIDEIINNLKYKLTNAQNSALNDVLTDITGPYTMNRLLQGDVGCGKTIIAELALINVCLCGYQGAIMVPTEVLAKQHFEDINRLLSDNGLMIKTELLVGSVTAAQKKKIYDRLKNHEIDIVIGTHALFQEKVTYDNLALVITDEQHRFGVKQRQIFGEKGDNPHVLVMSATPIPRTLAIILYGDLSVSVIDEMPSNRLAIKNCVVDTTYRPNAYKFINNQVKEGRQAYVICPMVEESEGLDAENVMDYTDKLRQIYPPSVNICALNGRMKPKEKNEIMQKFAKGEINILVSTTVVEVGVNVPNATVMMVENAERFGLAGLHQLRGRVGRGKYQSYCIFINTSKSKEAKQRLDILNKSNDGFYIANEDLKLRGSGDLFGIRQSGEMNFKIGDIIDDADILMKAAEAVDFCKDNKKITNEEYKLLNKKIEKFYDKAINNINL